MVLNKLWNSCNSSNVLFIAFTLVIVILYQIVLKNWLYFLHRNVRFVRGWPIVGSLHEFFFGDKSFGAVMLQFYRRFPNDQLFGIYEITHPIYVIRDPDLIKQITMQAFDHFHNHQSNFDIAVDSLLGRTLFFIRDQQWKEMRSILTPAFTGNKMRMMFDLVRESTADCMNALNSIDTPKVKCDNGGFEMELKDLFSRYTTSIIATCAFGINVDAIVDRNNEFFECGKIITNFDGLQGAKLLMLDAIPSVMKFLRIKFLETKISNYFRNVVKSAIDYREKNNIFRPDMIHLLMEARKGTLSDGESCDFKKTNWEDDDVVAQCLIFFFAGFETTSTLLCFMLYELACNDDVQQRLYEEILEHELNGRHTITYEMVQNFKYLDAVVSETLRLWPPLPTTDRQVTKPFRLERADGTFVELTTNDAIWIPIYGLHLDEKYWSEPNRFDPERFSDENRKNIRVGTYLPFGHGQRNCIASRFALMVAKTACYFVLREYRLEKCSKTSVPIVLKANTINMHAKNGFWIHFQPR